MASVFLSYDREDAAMAGTVARVVRDEAAGGPDFCFDPDLPYVCEVEVGKLDRTVA
ncbi:MAG TPA: hypothetical protein VFO42_04450 [Sphingomicrobium sp.]|nr:hypothetical protein [Sphingomicrobium sp.]